jgi:hypothetical protein
MANAGVGRPMALRKMATEVGKELAWQDAPFCVLEHYRAADTFDCPSTRI